MICGIEFADELVDNRLTALGSLPVKYSGFFQYIAKIDICV